MPLPRSAGSLSRRLIAPVAGLVLAAVIANVAFAGWLAARRALDTSRTRQEAVVRTLADSRVALSPQVLDTLARLTGSQFIVWNPATRAAELSTVPATETPDLDAALAAAAGGGTVMIAGARHRVAATRVQGVRPETVLVFTPVPGMLATTLEAVWPVLAVAAATLAVLVPLGLRTTGRIAARIAAVEAHVGRIAGGDFGTLLPPLATEPAAEVDRLVTGVNALSGKLATLRDALLAGERQRLLGQLAAGFAHELRNAITGARLAIDLHRRRCPANGGTAPTSGPPADESLAVAVRQLDIVAEEVRGLLALGRPTETPAGEIDVAALLADVRDLTTPRCEHAGVRLLAAAPQGVVIAGRREPLRAALVNLVLNAIDAAGRGGSVWLAAETGNGRFTFAVEDDGSGPPPAIAATLAEPFVTGKPEGIGLGLAVARAVAEEHGGRLEWQRVAGRTRFAIVLPLSSAGRPPAEGSP
jgi:signal transduction histidine kinase